MTNRKSKSNRKSKKANSSKKPTPPASQHPDTPYTGSANQPSNDQPQPVVAGTARLTQQPVAAAAPVTVTQPPLPPANVAVSVAQCVQQPVAAAAAAAGRVQYAAAVPFPCANFDESLTQAILNYQNSNGYALANDASVSIEQRAIQLLHQQQAAHEYGILQKDGSRVPELTPEQHARYAALFPQVEPIQTAPIASTANISPIAGSQQVINNSLLLSPTRRVNSTPSSQTSSQLSPARRKIKARRRNQQELEGVLKGSRLNFANINLSELGSPPRTRSVSAEVFQAANSAALGHNTDQQSTTSSGVGLTYMAGSLPEVSNYIQTHAMGNAPLDRSRPLGLPPATASTSITAQQPIPIITQANALGDFDLGNSGANLTAQQLKSLLALTSSASMIRNVTQDTTVSTVDVGSRPDRVPSPREEQLNKMFPNFKFTTLDEINKHAEQSSSETGGRPATGARGNLKPGNPLLFADTWNRPMKSTASGPTNTAPRIARKKSPAWGRTSETRASVQSHDLHYSFSSQTLATTGATVGATTSNGVIQTVAREFETFEQEIAFMQFCEYKTDFSWRTLPHDAFQSDPFRAFSTLEETEAASKVKLPRSMRDSDDDSDEELMDEQLKAMQNDWAELRSWVGMLYRYGRDAKQRCVSSQHIAEELHEKSQRLMAKDAPQFFARICRIAQDHMIALKAAFLRRLTIYRHMIKSTASESNDESDPEQKSVEHESKDETKAAVKPVPSEELPSESAQTDRMSVLFLKEVLREVEAIVDSATSVRFICPTLDSKFLADYDINWELYNLYLFNTVVLGEEGIQAVYQHGLNSIRNDQDATDQTLNTAALSSNPSAVSSHTQIQQELGRQRKAIRRTQFLLQQATQRWREVGPQITQIALQKISLVEHELSKFGKEPEKLPASSMPRPLGKTANIDAVASRFITHMHDLPLNNRQELSKKEFYRRFLQNPTGDQRRDLLGEGPPRYHNDDNSTWLMKDAREEAIRKADESSSDEEIDDNRSNASSFIASCSSKSSDIFPPAPRKLTGKTLERARAAQAAGLPLTPEFYDDTVSENSSIVMVRRNSETLQSELGTNPFERGLLSAEIYKRGGSGFDGLFDIIRAELQKDLNMSGVFDDMEGGESAVFHEIKPKTFLPGADDENAGFFKDHPVSVNTTCGKWTMTSYPSVTDDWEWDSPIWQANPVFTLQANSTPGSATEVKPPPSFKVDSERRPVNEKAKEGDKLRRALRANMEIDSVGKGLTQLKLGSWAKAPTTEELMTKLNKMTHPDYYNYIDSPDEEDLKRATGGMFQSREPKGEYGVCAEGEEPLTKEQLQEKTRILGEQVKRIREKNASRMDAGQRLEKLGKQVLKEHQGKFTDTDKLAAIYGEGSPDSFASAIPAAARRTLEKRHNQPFQSLDLTAGLDLSKSERPELFQKLIQNAMIDAEKLRQQSIPQKEYTQAAIRILKEGIDNNKTIFGGDTLPDVSEIEAAINRDIDTEITKDMNMMKYEDRPKPKNPYAKDMSMKNSDFDLGISVKEATKPMTYPQLIGYNNLLKSMGEADSGKELAEKMDALYLETKQGLANQMKPAAEMMKQHISPTNSDSSRGSPTRQESVTSCLSSNSINTISSDLENIRYNSDTGDHFQQVMSKSKVPNLPHTGPNGQPVTGKGAGSPTTGLQLSDFASVFDSAVSEVINASEPKTVKLFEQLLRESTEKGKMTIKTELDKLGDKVDLEKLDAGDFQEVANDIMKKHYTLSSAKMADTATRLAASDVSSSLREFEQKMDSFNISSESKDQTQRQIKELQTLISRNSWQAPGCDSLANIGELHKRISGIDMENFLKTYQQKKVQEEREMEKAFADLQDDNALEFNKELVRQHRLSKQSDGSARAGNSTETFDSKQIPEWVDDSRSSTESNEYVEYVGSQESTTQPPKMAKGLYGEKFMPLNRKRKTDGAHGVSKIIDESDDFYSDSPYPEPSTSNPYLPTTQGNASKSIIQSHYNPAAGALRPDNLPFVDPGLAASDAPKFHPAKGMDQINTVPTQAPLPTSSQPAIMTGDQAGIDHNNSTQHQLGAAALQAAQAVANVGNVSNMDQLVTTACYQNQNHSGHQARQRLAENFKKKLEEQQNTGDQPDQPPLTQAAPASPAQNMSIDDIMKFVEGAPESSKKPKKAKKTKKPTKDAKRSEAASASPTPPSKPPTPTAAVEPKPTSGAGDSATKAPLPALQKLAKSAPSASISPDSAAISRESSRSKDGSVSVQGTVESQSGTSASASPAPLKREMIKLSKKEKKRLERERKQQVEKERREQRKIKQEEERIRKEAEKIEREQSAKTEAQAGDSGKRLAFPCIEMMTADRDFSSDSDDSIVNGFEKFCQETSAAIKENVPKVPISW